MMRNNDMSKAALLHEISKVDFAVVEMTLYLDTHPDECEAIAYLNHYVKLKNQLEKEYSYKYEPMSVALAPESDGNKWLWALAPMPWEGGCR